MTADAGPVEELTRAFARMSGVLLSEATVSTALSTVTSLAADTIAGSTGSGVSLLDPNGQRTTAAATDSLVEQLDNLQYELDEGPCLAAWRDLTVVRSDGQGDETRWPTWTQRAQQLGMRSVLSAPMINGETAIGAIKVYSDVAAAFDQRSEDLLQRFAAQAAIFVGNVLTVRAAVRLSEQLKQTLRTRDLIATARGIVMAREGVDSDEAFRELMGKSHRARRPVRDVAAQIVASQSDS